MRGGLDDALDKLARRDELRRRAAREAMGTPPAVQDLVEAIAAVVGRNPALAVTVGVEGAGDPMLLHFTVENGIVQVSADNTVASRVAEAAPTSPRHADFDIDPDEPDSYPATSAHESPFETGQATRRISYDEPGAAYATGPYRPAPPAGDDGYATEPVANHRRLDPPDDGYPRPPDSAFPPGAGRASRFGATSDSFAQASRASSGQFGATSPDPHEVTRAYPFSGIPSYPFADSPSPAFAGGASHQFGRPGQPSSPAETTRRIHIDQQRVPEEQPAAARKRDHRLAEPEQRGMPAPLPKPIPLDVDTTETEQAAKRLAALLRDNPTLLRRSSAD